MTGHVNIDLFTTLDGVAQAPGGPDEDPSNGFRFGGWQAPLPSDAVGRSAAEHIEAYDAMVLGRRTYDIFASYWPFHTTGPEGNIGRKFDAIPKYVASRATPELTWQGSERIGSDLHREIAQIRASHQNIGVIGSIDFVQTLLTELLFDELRLWVYPIVLGGGKKVFPDGASPARLRLLDDAVTGDGGTVLLRYGPLEGAPETGTMSD